MKTMMLAAAALTLSMGAAFANEGGPVANSQFTEIPGVIAQAQVQNPTVATTQNGQSVQVYGTSSRYGTWLFAPSDGGGANN